MRDLLSDLHIHFTLRDIGDDWVRSVLRRRFLKALENSRELLLTSFQVLYFYFRLQSRDPNHSCRLIGPYRRGGLRQ